jgi:hypothetical protein
MTLMGVLALYASFGLLRLSRSERMAAPGAKAISHLSVCLLVLVAAVHHQVRQKCLQIRQRLFWLGVPDHLSRHAEQLQPDREPRG